MKAEILNLYCLMLSKAICLTLSLFSCQLLFSDTVLEDFENLEGWREISFKNSYRKISEAKTGNSSIEVKFPVFIEKSYHYDWKARLDWDSKYKGLSFWVKGDGSDQWGSISIGGYGSWSYIYYFPVKNKEWTRFLVPWEKFVADGGVVQGINTKGALPICGISRIAIGNKWEISHCNRKILPFKYCIDNIELVEETDTIAAERKEFQTPYKAMDFKKVLNKFKNGEKVTIFCFGDSITAGTSLAKADEERYAVLLQKKLREHFKRDNIHVESRAVGGARTYHETAWLDRDFSDKLPDLVTFMIGYNNKSSAFTCDTFKKSLEDYLNRLTVKTKGKTAILLIPPIPGRDHRFNMMDDYACVFMDLATERNLPACDDVRMAFKKLGGKDIGDYMSDTAHPNSKGHALLADTLASYIIRQGEKTN